MFTRYTLAALLVVGATAQNFPVGNTSFASSFTALNVPMLPCVNDT